MKRSTAAASAAPSAAGADATGVERVTNNNHHRRSGNFPSTTIRLLLHTVDGIIPYLTPNLLRQCFPADDNMRNQLMVGVPVRDTCVVPVYADNKDDDETNNNNNNNKKLKKKKGRQRKQNNPKGYEFSSSNCQQKAMIDSWILPYERVIVPVFELHVDDHHMSHHRQYQGKRAPVFDAVNNSGQLICTTNGRVPLTPHNYFEIAACASTNAGLQQSQSHDVTVTTVPLFDMIPFHNLHDDRQKNNPYFKRKETAIRRCQQWLYDFVNDEQQYEKKQKKKNSSSRDGNKDEDKTGSSGTVWAPVVIDQEGVDGTCDNDSDDDYYFGKQVDRVLSGRITRIKSSTKSTTTQPAKSVVAADGMIQGSFIQPPPPPPPPQPSSTTSSVPSIDATKIIKGIVVIGWERIHNSQKRQSTIQFVKNKILQQQQQQQQQQLPLSPTSVTDIVILSTHSLSQLLDAACAGCNVIGTDLPRQWAKSHKAFVVDFAAAAAAAAAAGTSSTAAADGDESKEPSKPTKKARLARNNSNNNNSSALSGLSLDENGCIDLSSSTTSNKNDDATGVSSHVWFDDTNPMVLGCSCLACSTHSRAYIYHLICASELLGEIMLFIHNLHHCLELVRQFNTAHDLENNNSNNKDHRTVKDLVEYIESQLPTKGRTAS